MGIEQYKQMALDRNPKELTEQTLKSIMMYMDDLIDIRQDWGFRCEAGIAAITLLEAMSNSIVKDVPPEEQIILIKVFGQIIKSINSCMRGEITDLSKEFAGLKRLCKRKSLC
jgi:uncharacterized FlaG/YvyC family protein